MKKALLIFVLFTVIAPLAHAAQTEIWMKKGWDYALDGYDAVAYFTESKPVEGDDLYVTEY